MSTNITDEHQEAFNALRDPEYDNFALFSCFVGGEPASAIVAITDGDEDNYHVTPLFISVTPGMVITDHDGNSPG